MKKVLLFLIFFTVSLSAQTSKVKYWLDPEGKEVKNRFIRDLVKKYPDNSMSYRKTIDSGLVYQFNSPKYSTYKVDYSYVKQEIEKITNKTYSDSTIFILNFNYLDDNCSTCFSNNMTINQVNFLKKYFNQHKTEIEKNDNIKIISLFENGISIFNDSKNEDEYFYNDSNSFFRINLFKNPTLCGSYGLIKPNGQTIIRNGEYDLMSIYKHLKNRTWNKFFQQ
jgi:hypothetical protein